MFFKNQNQVQYYCIALAIEFIIILNWTCSREKFPIHFPSHGPEKQGHVKESVQEILLDTKDTWSVSGEIKEIVAS